MFHHNKNDSTTATGTHDKVEFRLRVIEGRGLYGGDRSSQSDPYLVVKLKGLKHIFNSEKQTSEVHQNNDNPVWNQDFLLHAKANDIILVKVYDRDRNKKDTYLGRVEIPATKYHTEASDSWIPLVGKKGAKAKGDLHVAATYGGAAIPTGFGLQSATGATANKDLKKDAIKPATTTTKDTTHNLNAPATGVAAAAVNKEVKKETTTTTTKDAKDSIKPATTTTTKEVHTDTGKEGANKILQAENKTQTTTQQGGNMVQQTTQHTATTIPQAANTTQQTSTAIPPVAAFADLQNQPYVFHYNANNILGQTTPATAVGQNAPIAEKTAPIAAPIAEKTTTATTNQTTTTTSH